MQISMSCPVCNSEELQEAWNVGDYALSRCLNCTHLFVSSGVDSAGLEQAYGQAYYDPGDPELAIGYQDYLKDAPKRLRGFAAKLEEIERYTDGRRGRVLDYGCAVGLFVKASADAGWDATGLERSQWAADYGRKSYGVNIVVSQDGAGVEFDKPFDMITMWDVLEHLEHPRRVLADVARWLKPGGVLALNTVNSSSYGARAAGADWRHIAPPHHLQYFSRRSLQELVRGCGFDLVATRSQGVMLQADKRRQRLGFLGDSVESCATHWRFKPAALALNLLDEIEIVARRDPAAAAR